MSDRSGRSGRYGHDHVSRGRKLHDLAVIIVSTNEAHWLRAALPTVFERAGDLDLDVVVVDNESTDGTAELVESEFPEARVVTARNHGFSHANNRALMTVDARYVLFLNPDTEILSGSLEELVRRLDAAPDVGLAGVVQTLANGSTWPSMRRFPNAWLTLMETLGSERFPFRAGWLTTRELDLRRYDEEFDLDWTSGSFMVARREALESAGWLDERFFLYSDESDLALRMKRAGWVVRHFPCVRIVHHYGKQGFSERGYAQAALSHRLYARKHFSQLHRLAFAAALAAYYGTRWAAYSVVRRSDGAAAAAMRASLRALLGGSTPPYQPLPPTAVRPREPARVRQPAA